ncbi:LysR family transcriptional regulator [Levilactobacillus suantsaii]|uniref:LysR family transcriptional regulator n=1 Tax=Levilactobacillus suantsaii TaxID=2292255 RepID=A0A4Q0VHY0_9LACO|nr:LysR family transcriptional regulator [Levilactobacillus suantsaii]QMU08797.1 LysR family transcriptional regulator [Levilactobacillus suantsaii]RXI78966.1 LysR family transcriptional regulator [Levilactobacillus suantsaii]
METRILRYFLTIVQQGSISKAATYLHVSQPALSQQIKALETTLGTTLFHRGPRTITLTAKGIYLADRAKEILALVDKTTNNLQTDQTVISGNLDLGAGESHGMQRLMALTSQLQSDYPDITIRLHSGNAADTVHRLNAGTLDFGVLMGETRIDVDQFNALRLPERDVWGVVLRKDATLAQKSVLHPADLVGWPLMVSAQGLQQTNLANWWQAVSDQLTIVGTYNLVFNAALLAQNGSCLVVTFDHLVNTDDLSPLTFRPLAPTLSDSITLIWRRYQRLSPAATLFLARLKANLATAVKPPARD